MQTRLAGVGTQELYRIARGVVEELGDEELEKLLAGDGFRGVGGDLWDLIFAAVGQKPRIVLLAAIDNVIEIIEGADRCLVYDRPLLPTASAGESSSRGGETAIPPTANVTRP